MKVFILVLISIFYTTTIYAEKHVPKKDEKLCKIFKDKAVKYKKTMRNDEYAMKTLMSYQKRIKIYCPDK
ncbi:MAG: hypothetical protein QM497_08975 [Sulfurimonas sp.]